MAESRGAHKRTALDCVERANATLTRDASLVSGLR
jgi:hypothetical protein